ncbi:MAG: glycosyltransferase, partial [Clostridium celatum]|nr:glycosyltransferase [Clostridium celatum]
NYIKENNLEESVYMLGNRSNVINLLSYIDLVLLCSYIEGLPLVPLEAFSKGVPVIATNILGTNEEVIDNFNGFLVETKDINIFEERIFEIYKNKELYNKMKENCIRIFEEKFNSDIYIEKHIKFYNKIVKF